MHVYKSSIKLSNFIANKKGDPNLSRLSLQAICFLHPRIPARPVRRVFRGLPIDKGGAGTSPATRF